MVAPVLLDYEFQFKDTGVLLNGPSVLPFWDVTNITGLVDFPELDTKVIDVDGRHGAFVASRFFSNRVIVFDGTFYADPANVDTAVQTLRSSVLPESSGSPLYFKMSGLAQRYVTAKSIGFKCDVSTARRYGSGSFQLQFSADDPRHYIDGAPVAWTSNVNFNLNNTGNTVHGPTVTITANATTTASIVITNNTLSETITLSFAVTNGDVLVINTDTLSVRKNNVYIPVLFNLTGSAWPTASPGVTESWKVVSNVGNGTITNKSSWL